MQNDHFQSIESSIFTLSRRKMNLNIRTITQIVYESRFIKNVCKRNTIVGKVVLAKREAFFDLSDLNQLVPVLKFCATIYYLPTKSFI
jgi:hypothetical protein